MCSSATFLMLTAACPSQGTVNFLSREAAKMADLAFYDSRTGLTHLKSDAKNK